MLLRRVAAAGLALSCLLIPAASRADSAVMTTPYPTLTTNASGTVATTNTFQAVFAAKRMQDFNPARLGCTIINYGTHTMYVHADPSTATLANSVQLSAGQAFFCNSSGIVLTEAVSLTGTAGDAFYAAAQ